MSSTAVTFNICCVKADNPLSPFHHEDKFPLRSQFLFPKDLISTHRNIEKTEHFPLEASTILLLLSIIKTNFFSICCFMSFRRTCLTRAGGKAPRNTTLKGHHTASLSRTPLLSVFLRFSTAFFFFLLTFPIPSLMTFDSLQITSLLS